MPSKELQPKEAAPWKEHTSASASASVFLSDNQGKLLMVQDIDAFGGKWSPIAGFVDVNLKEEPEMAAIREAKEELGLDVRLDELIGVWHYYAADDKDSVAYGKTAKPDTDRAHMHIGYAYRGTILGGTFSMQPEEIQNWGFFTPEDVEKMHGAGLLKTPQYNYVGFKLWRDGAHHPLSVIQTNGKMQ